MHSSITKKRSQNSSTAKQADSIIAIAKHVHAPTHCAVLEPRVDVI